MEPESLPATRRRITLERTFQSTPGQVWSMWTTADGIESWWGPDGFEVKVKGLDLRPGGRLDYVMTASGPDQVEFLKKAGMPLVTEHSVTYTEVVEPRRLAFFIVADFIPGVEPYEVATVIDLDPTPLGVRLSLTCDAMHDERWTQLATMGRESELDRLAKLLAGRT